MGPYLFVGDLLLRDELHDVLSGYTKQIGGLLRGHQHLGRHHTDGLPLSHLVGDDLQNLEYRPRHSQFIGFLTLHDDLDVVHWYVLESTRKRLDNLAVLFGRRNWGRDRHGCMLRNNRYKRNIRHKPHSVRVTHRPRAMWSPQWPHPPPGFWAPAASGASIRHNGRHERC